MPVIRGVAFLRYCFDRPLVAKNKEIVMDSKKESSSIDLLISKIEQAFADVTYPDDGDITNSTYGQEPIDLVREFCGKVDWRELDAKFLDQAPDGCGSALCIMFFFTQRFLLLSPSLHDCRYTGSTELLQSGISFM